MKTSKRLWALLLTVCMVLAMIPAVSAAKDEVTGTFTYDFDALKIANANDIAFSGQTTYLTNAGTVLAQMKAAGLIDWQFKATTITRADYAAFAANGYVYGRAGGNQYIAFEIDNPGQGKYALSVNHALSSNGAGGIGVYIIPGDTADIAAALTEDTRVGSYTCYLAGEANNYNTTNITSSDLTGTWEVKDDNSAIVVFRLEEYPSGRARMYLSQLILTPVAEEKEDEAMIGTKPYATLQDAIDNAKPEDEIDLQTDVEADKVTVPAGVTLDLNGKTLTAGEINIAGALVDTVGDGLLVTNATITCSSDNGGYLPLTDSAAGGYRLCKPTLETLGKVPGETGTAAYWFHAHFEKEAAYGYTGVEIGVQMTWDGGSKNANADDTFMSNWATRVKADKDLDIKLTVKGLDTVTNFKLTPVIKANGVTISMDTL